MESSFAGAIRSLQRDLADGHLAPWDLLKPLTQRAIRRLGLSASAYDEDRAVGRHATLRALVELELTTLRPDDAQRLASVHD